MFSDSRQNPIRDSLRDPNKYNKSSDYSPKYKYKPGFTSDKFKNDYKGISRVNKFNCDSFKTKYNVFMSRRGKSKIPQTTITSRKRELVEREEKIYEEEMKL